METVIERLIALELNVKDLKASKEVLEGKVKKQAIKIRDMGLKLAAVRQSVFEPAAHRLIAVTEILEDILLHTPAQTILRCLAVNRRFKAVIDGSKSLQESALFAPSAKIGATGLNYLTHLALADIRRNLFMALNLGRTTNYLNVYLNWSAVSSGTQVELVVDFRDASRKTREAARLILLRVASMKYDQLPFTQPPTPIIVSARYSVITCQGLHDFLSVALYSSSKHRMTSPHHCNQEKERDLLVSASIASGTLGDAVHLTAKIVLMDPATIYNEQYGYPLLNCAGLPLTKSMLRIPAKDVKLLEEDYQSNTATGPA